MLHLGQKKTEAYKASHDCFLLLFDVLSGRKNPWFTSLTCLYLLDLYNPTQDADDMKLFLGKRESRSKPAFATSQHPGLGK